jgi:hypothetical protein
MSKCELVCADSEVDRMRFLWPDLEKIVPVSKVFLLGTPLGSEEEAQAHLQKVAEKSIRRANLITRLGDSVVASALLRYTTGFCIGNGQLCPKTSSQSRPRGPGDIAASGATYRQLIRGRIRTALFARLSSGRRHAGEREGRRSGRIASAWVASGSETTAAALRLAKARENNRGARKRGSFGSVSRSTVVSSSGVDQPRGIDVRERKPLLGLPRR